MVSEISSGKSAKESRAPAVSIGLPVYNGARYLERALETLLAQRFLDFELIISDNASTDRTPQICEAYAAGDARLRYVRAPVNRGASWNFNHVAGLAQADMFVWAAHDDEWLPEFLGCCVAVLRQRPNVVACYTQHQPIGDGGLAHGVPAGIGCEGASRRVRWNHVLRNWAVHGSIYGVMRTEAVRRTRGLRPCISGDLVFMSELLLHGELIVLPEPLHRKRMPLPSAPFRDRGELLLTLTGKRSRPRLLQRYGVLHEVLAGLQHAKFPADERLVLARDAWQHYFASGDWLNDGKDIVKGLIGRERFVNQ